MLVALYENFHKSLCSIDALIMDEQIGDNVKVEAPVVEKKKNEVKPAEHIKEGRRNKEEKNKKKDDKRPAEQFLRSLSDVHSVEEKLELMCKKYSEIVDENRKLQLTLKQYDKKILTLQREKEQFQSERSKAALTRGRLESLCRELQKQNKAVKEESLLKIREQEEMRKKLSEKFQGGLAKIKAIMNQNIEKNAKIYEENLEMNQKVKAVYQHVEHQERQLLKVHEKIKYQLQMAGVELEKVKMEATVEKKALLKEKHQLLYKLTEYQAQIQELQATEVALRSQISMYTDKYDEFQNALTRSNKVYGEFNEEMEKMSKKILVLEKETTLWKQKWENSHAALLEMAADKQLRDSEIVTLNKKLSLLQDLCKAFQFERANLLAQLKAKNKTFQPETPTEAESNAQENNKSIKQVDELSKDCAKLQDSFGQLQDSLAKVSETVQKELAEEVPEKDTVQSKKDTDLTPTEKEESNVNIENKEIERLECKDEDTKQQVDEDSKQQTVEDTKQQTDEGTKQQINDDTKLQINDDAKPQINGDSKQRIDEDTKQQTDEDTKQITDEDTKQITDEDTKHQTGEDTKQQTDEDTKQQTDKDTKQQTDEDTKQQTDEDTKQQTDEDTKQQTDEDTKQQTDEDTKQQTDEDTKQQTDEDTKQQTDEDNGLPQSEELTKLVDEISDAEVLTNCEVSDNIQELVKEENLTEEPSDKDIVALDKEHINVELSEKDCLPQPIAEVKIEELKDEKTGEDRLECENSNNSECTEENASLLQAENIELNPTSLNAEENSSIELNDNEICSNTQEETNEEVNSNVIDIYDQIESLRSETENMIEQLYESVRHRNETLRSTINGILNSESAKNLDNVNSEDAGLDTTSPNEQSNDRLDGDVSSHEVTCTNVIASEDEVPLDTMSTENVMNDNQQCQKMQVEADNHTTIEQIVSSIPIEDTLPKEQSLETDVSLIKTDNSETKSNKSIPIKNGKRRKK